MPQIVLLKNITLDDLRKSISHVKPTDTQQELQEYEELPTVFYSVDDWPKTTKLQCRICQQVPIGPPKMVATYKFSDMKGNTVYQVEGPFHEWCCASLYISIWHPQHIAERQSWLTEMEYAFSGVKKIKIPEAQSPFLMRHYSGDKTGLTIEQWNAQNKEKTSREQIFATLRSAARC